MLVVCFFHCFTGKVCLLQLFCNLLLISDFFVLTGCRPKHFSKIILKASPVFTLLFLNLNVMHMFLSRLIFLYGKIRALISNVVIELFVFPQPRPTRGRMRIHCLENVDKALQFLKEQRVHLENVGSHDIVDGNHRLTLGLMWTIILRFQVNTYKTTFYHSSAMYWPCLGAVSWTVTSGGHSQGLTILT